MTPKEKSEYLVEYFINDHLSLSVSHSRLCAIITAENVIKELDDLYSNANVSDSSEIEVKKKSAFWNEVITELKAIK